MKQQKRVDANDKRCCCGDFLMAVVAKSTVRQCAPRILVSCLDHLQSLIVRVCTLMFPALLFVLVPSFVV